MFPVNPGPIRTPAARELPRGLVKPADGSITFGERAITGLRPDKITGFGLCQVPEGRAVLARLTVLENLQMGAYRRRHQITADLDKVLDRFPRLAERKALLAGTLSGASSRCW